MHSGLPNPLRATFDGKGQHQTFADLNTALARCEDQLLADAKLDSGTALAGLETWVQRQLGPEFAAAEFIAFIERKDIDAPQILYRRAKASACAA